jgi:prepilin-type N-terminal cleavage/methylation domain-containing protein
MKTKTSPKTAFTLVEIMIVVAIIGLLAAVAIPNFLHARSKSQQTACINNLRQLDQAKQAWAMEKGKSSSDTPVQSDVQPYLGRGSSGTLPCCPLDSTRVFINSYTLGDVSNAPVCNLNGNGQKDPATPHELPRGAS